MAKIGSPYVHKFKVTVEWQSGLDEGVRELSLTNDNSQHATRMYTMCAIMDIMSLASQQQVSPSGEKGFSESPGGQP